MTTILGVLNTFKSRSQAREFHAQLIKHKGPLSSYSFILSIYANLNLLRDSLLVFNTLNHSLATSVAWRSIIRSCASNGLSLQALQNFTKMNSFGKRPVREPCVPFCGEVFAILGWQHLGEAAHGCIVKVGVGCELYTGNALMNMYAKFQKITVSDILRR